MKHKPNKSKMDEINLTECQVPLLIAKYMKGFGSRFQILFHAKGLSDS